MILVRISSLIIPLLFLYIIGNGLLQKIPVYDVFVEGAKGGVSTVVSILPTLVGLMVGVGMLRASGFLDFLANVLAVPAEWIGFPKELVPLAIVRMFSSSAATGLALDVFGQWGPDSFLGRVTSLMMSCTETIFYTMSVYFLAAKVRKTRYTLAGALVSMLSGVIMSVWLAGLM